ncbi:MAG: hypothetical protein QOH91_1610 [Mycobacterium sp.]|jgi:hypothetical protein|nr:hypothetical protein [Mycobacterium sp.]
MTDDFERQLAELAKIDAELDALWQRIRQLAHDDQRRPPTLVEPLRAVE